MRFRIKTQAKAGALLKGAKRKRGDFASLSGENFGNGNARTTSGRIQRQRRNHEAGGTVEATVVGWRLPRARTSSRAL